MIARFHYDEKMLSRLLRDEPGSEVREIQEHVEKCDLCQTQLESLSAGDMTWDDVCDLMRTDDLFDYDIADAKTTPESKATFLEASEDPNSLGRFGRYEIQEVLGRGGMGIVMRGVDSALDRHCAIKVLAPELASSAAARKRFSREARSAAAVVHPHVVPIQTVDEQDGLPYLVMPVVEGQSLAQRVDANGPLEVVQTVRIAAQIADGLSAAHRQGLVHRDIKPANVLLENDVDRVQITDFGLARAVDDASMTRSGVIAGTPQYMSPEQAHGDTIDHRSDLFSLGSVMYFMLTGRSPFRAETSMGVLNRICNDQPRSLRSINAEVPEWLATIVTKLLEKSPDDRFQSANELANLLADRLTQMNNPDSGHRAALDDAESESEPKVSFAANPPNRLRRIVIAAGFAFVALAGTLFYLQTNKGTLQIESNSDLDVPVRIMSGDETVEQLTVSREGATTRLQAGNYVIEVDDADSHVEVKGDRFTLRRGETWIVSITPVTKSSGRGQEFNSGTEHMGDPTGSLMEEQMKHFMELHDSDGQMDGWPMGSDKGGSPMAPPGGLMGGGGTLGGHADGVDLIETDAGWMVDDLWPDADTAVDDAGKAILGDGTADLSEMLPGGPPRQDWKTGLQGRWHVEMKSYDDEGKLKSSTVQGHVMGNRITLTGDDGVPVSFAFEFGVDGPPKQIDLRPAITDDDEQLLLSGWDRESGNPPEALVNPTFHAIVKESKDGFEFCLPATPGERPSDFSISTDRGMWILRREPVKPSREALPKAKESHVRGAGKVVALVPQEQAQSVDSPVPDTSELAVELWISGNDAPLVQRGDRVRLQFEGWPPVDGGTFAGEVMTVDPTADGDGRFRLVVKADGKDSWPDERYLRPGVPAIGWVLTEDAKRIRRVIESLMPQ